MSAEAAEKEQVDLPRIQVVETPADPAYVSRCCRKDGEVSKALVRFLVTVFFTASLMGFAMFKLGLESTSSEERAIYYSLLTSVISLYVPAPTPHDT